MDDKAKASLDATLVLATITAIGYFIGARFMAGYFGYFGITPDFLGFSVPAYLETGMFHTALFFGFWMLAWAASKAGERSWLGHVPVMLLVLYTAFLVQRAKELGLSSGNLSVAVIVVVGLAVQSVASWPSLGEWLAVALRKGRVLVAVALLGATSLPFGYGAQVWGRDRAIQRAAARDYREVIVHPQGDLPEAPLLLIAHVGGYAYLIERYARIFGKPVVWVVPDERIRSLRIGGRPVAK